MDKKHWIFLSPHFDDVALSCGGLVWDLAQQGHSVEIWTLMGGFPPDEAYSEFAQQNHLRWGLSGKEVVLIRQAEDHAACQVLGVQPRHFSWPDAIYRRDQVTKEHLFLNNDDLFGKVPQQSLVRNIQLVLEKEIPQETRIVFPIGLGNHVDHQAVAMAGETFAGQNFYYADYPYILKAFEFQKPINPRWEKLPHPLSITALHHWQDAILCYESQFKDFWRDKEESRLAVSNYLAGGGGRLWKKSNRIPYYYDKIPVC
jgi:LmbE family N-acetylglucosaminyl deacetylase